MTGEVLPRATLDLAARLLAALQPRGITMATAESCTGGLIAGAITAIPGSSATLLEGFVTYSNEAKTRAVGVPAEMIQSFGAVSEPVARAMAEGAARVAGAGLAVSATGVAGPGGGSDAKPVGTVFIGAARPGGPSLVRHCLFPGDRDAVRRATVDTALRLAAEACGIALDSPIAS